jgi:hypothetical protein
MKMFNKFSMGVAILAAVFVFGLVGSAMAATQVNLFTAYDFAVLGGSGITNTNATTITGNIGTFPTTTITGIGSITLNGTNHAGDAVTQGAKDDLVTAYNDAAGQTCTTTYASPTDIGGSTLTPGVYCFASSGAITGTLTLNEQNDPDAVFIFKFGSGLTTASNSNVIFTHPLIGQACHVFWQVGSSATLGTSTNFIGTIMTMTSITLTSGASVTGRLLARNGSVTLDNNTIITSKCSASSVATLHVIKKVVNDNNGTSSAADFDLTVRLSGNDNGGSTAPGAESPGNSYSLSPGTYTISEADDASYNQSFSGDCDSDGIITLAGGHDYTCTVTNNDTSGDTDSDKDVAIKVKKTASDYKLQSGPDKVTFTYKVTNEGDLSLRHIIVKDDKCDDVKYDSGDDDRDDRLDKDEKWEYSCTKTVSKTETNKVTAKGTANGKEVEDTDKVKVTVSTPSLPSAGFRNDNKLWNIIFQKSSPLF